MTTPPITGPLDQPTSPERPPLAAVKLTESASGQLNFVGFDNPFKLIRIHAGLSQQNLANKVGISKHAVLRSEQGMYVEPLPSLLNYMCNNFPVGRLTLIQQYERFQVYTRETSGRLLGDMESELDTWHTYLHSSPTALSPYQLHPLVWLRTIRGYNPTSLAKAICVNQTVVNYFEKNSINQRTIPEQLTHALKDCGYEDDELASLADAYSVYREFLLANQSFRVIK